MDLAGYLRIQARANGLSNQRLGAALALLPAADWSVPRTGFFPSIDGTLNHILAVDRYYIAALRRQSDPRLEWHDFAPCSGVAAWRQRQQASDLQLIELCESLDAAGLDAWVDLPRRDHVQRDRVGHVLAHLFNHQTHHRGQVHAMLSGTTVAPPQLDEFMMPSEAHLRRADMQTMGWNEAAVYGAAPE